MSKLQLFLEMGKIIVHQSKRSFSIERKENIQTSLHLIPYNSQIEIVIFEKHEPEEKKLEKSIE